MFFSTGGEDGKKNKIVESENGWSNGGGGGDGGVDKRAGNGVFGLGIVNPDEYERESHQSIRSNGAVIMRPGDFFFFSFWVCFSAQAPLLIAEGIICMYGRHSIGSITLNLI